MAKASEAHAAVQAKLAAKTAEKEDMKATLEKSLVVGSDDKKKLTALEEQKAILEDALKDAQKKTSKMPRVESL